MIGTRFVSRRLTAHLLSVVLVLAFGDAGDLVAAPPAKTPPPGAVVVPPGGVVVPPGAVVVPPGGVVVPPGGVVVPPGGVVVPPGGLVPYTPSCDTAFAPMPQPPPCMPILETVYVSPLGTIPGRVTSVSYDGSVPIQPADTITFRVRAPYPTQMVVLVNGQPLPQIAPGGPAPSPDAAGYYSVVSVQPLPGPATAWQFWSIAMKLPKPFRFVANNINVPPLLVTLRDISVAPFVGAAQTAQKQAPDLNIPLGGWPPASNPAAPSEAFFTGENSKDDTDVPSIDLVAKIPYSPPMPRARLGIVARSVTLAGWLTGGDDLAGSPEDFHFSITVDYDFIQRNYPPDALPLRGAMLPGQPVRQACWVWHHAFGGDYACPCGAGPLGDLPGCVQRLPLANAPVLDVGSLVLPGQQYFDCCELGVELNAWHRDARPQPVPTGYLQDQTSMPHASDFLRSLPAGSPPVIPNNFWAIDPVHGTHFPPNAPQHVLQAGDYVIITGTLWQDTCHACTTQTGPPPTPPDPAHVCWDKAHPADAGWLEIHPPDVVRFVSPKPTLRRQPFMVAACSDTPGIPAVYPGPRDPPFLDLRQYAQETHVPELQPTPNSVLRFQEFPDPRFTDPDASHILKNASIGCGPDGTMSVLNASASDQNPNAIKTYKSVFLLWWEDSPTPRPPCPRLTSISGSVSQQLAVRGQPFALVAAFKVLDKATMQPVPGMSVWVQDLVGNKQSSGTTAADGTVRLPFAPCPVSPYGPSVSWVPSPACPVFGTATGYVGFGSFTPVLAATANRDAFQNSLSVRVSDPLVQVDPLTKASVAGAAVSVLDGQGQTRVSGTTAADGTVSLPLSGVTCGFNSSCTVVVAKAGYLSCSFALPSLGGNATCR